jgi:molybdate transport system regulatory protein
LENNGKTPVVSFKIGGKPIHLMTKFWLEAEKGYAFGEGPFQLLCKISEHGTLSEASRDMGMSYRHAWGVLKEVENRMGISLLKTHKGGTQGGGGAELTDEAKELVSHYLHLKEAYLETMNQLTARSLGAGLGSEGRLEGTVIKVKENGSISTLHIKIDPEESISILTDTADVQKKGIGAGSKAKIELRDALMTVERS